MTWTDRRGSKLAIREVLIPAVRELLAARRNVRAQARLPRRTDARPAPSPAEPGPGAGVDVGQPPGAEPLEGVGTNVPWAP